MPEIITEAKKMEADVIAISETHGDEASRRMPTIKGFKPFKTDRKIENHWGGVAIYVRRDIRPYEIEQKEHDEHLDEVKWVAISHEKENIALCVAYIKPGRPIKCYRDIVGRIQKRQRELEELGWKVIVMGDFNAHVGNGTGGIAGNHEKLDAEGKEIHNWINNSGSILVNAHDNCRGIWTWSRGDKTSVVDYIITSGDLDQDIEELFIDDEGEYDIGSDHNWMWLRLRYKRIPKEHVKKQPGWNINEDTDWKAFSKDLERVAAEWEQPQVEDMTPEEAVETMVTSLNDMLMVSGKRVVGLKERRQGRWGDSGLSKEAQTMISRRKAAARAHKRAAKLQKAKHEVERRATEFSVLKKQADDIRARERAKKREKMLQAAQRDKSLNTLWSEVRRLKKGKDGVTSIKNKQGQRLTTREEIAKELADHANSLFNNNSTPQHINTDSETAQTEGETDNPDLTQPFTREELDHAIRKLKRGKAIGADKIPNEFLKASGPVFRRKLLAVLNQVLQLEAIPEVWRQSRLSMIPKKGDLSLLDNYRGIAINSNIGKLFTKLIAARLEQDVELRRILGLIQHGFRKGMQSTDALYILNRILGKHGQRDGLYMAFLDIRKAYDRVNRQKLWDRMKELGYGGKLLRILQALYKDLSAVVTLDDITSDTVRMSQGLKQGCCLSPLLFAIYISDLGRQLEQAGKGYDFEGMKVPGLFFADDMALLATSGKELEELLNITYDFGLSMDIEFNGTKSVVMVAGREVDNDRVWFIGQQQISEDVGYELIPPEEYDETHMYVEQEVTIHTEMGPSMNEIGEFKYLGQWVQVLQPRNEELAGKMKSRAEQLKTQVLRLARESFNFSYVARNLWEKVAMPAILYGSEATELTETDLQQVEMVQREVARSITGALNSTAIQGMYGELDWKEIYTRVAERRLNYLHRLTNIGGDWWCKQVFMKLGGLQSRDGWMNQVREDIHYMKMQIDTVTTVPREQWKGAVKKAIRARYKSQYQNATGLQTSLRFLEAKQEPRLEQYLDGSRGAKLLFQARTGQMECTGSRAEKLGKTTGESARTNPDTRGRPRCSYCGMEAKDDVQHLLLECTLHETLRQTLWESMDDDRETIQQKGKVKQVQYLLGIGKGANKDLQSICMFLKRAAQDREEGDRKRGEVA